MKVLVLGMLFGQQSLAFPSSLVHGNGHDLSTSAPLPPDLCPPCLSHDILFLLQGLVQMQLYEEFPLMSAG